MPTPVTPGGQPLPRDLPAGYYRDQQGRIFDSAGRQIDPKTGRPLQGGAVSGAVGPQPAPASPVTSPTNPSPPSPGPVRNPVTNPTPVSPSVAAKPVAPQPDASGDYDPYSPGIQKSPVGIHGHPGQEKWAPDDKYGQGMRQNTNQAGVQSNGDDDPWLIGAFEGGTYDPGVIREWVARAAKGDPAADWLLKQVGADKYKGVEEWAAARNLHTYQQDFSPGGRWYGDPKGGAGGAVADNGFDTSAKAVGAKSIEHGTEEPYPGYRVDAPLPFHGNTGPDTAPDPLARVGDKTDINDTERLPWHDDPAPQVEQAPKKQVGRNRYFDNGV